jgi:hypothetical protein
VFCAGLKLGLQKSEFFRGTPTPDPQPMKTLPEQCQSGDPHKKDDGGGKNLLGRWRGAHRAHF